MIREQIWLLWSSRGSENQNFFGYIEQRLTWTKRLWQGVRSRTQKQEGHTLSRNSSLLFCLLLSSSVVFGVFEGNEYGLMWSNGRF